MEIHKCDQCATELKIGIPIEINFGFGSLEDGTRVEFCKAQHAIDYLTGKEEKGKVKKKRLYKHFGVIADIREDKEGYEIGDSDKTYVYLHKSQLTVASPLIEKGRIICIITNQPAQGTIHSVYIQVLSKDYGEHGLFDKNRDYYTNFQKTGLEKIPSFTLLYTP